MFSPSPTSTSIRRFPGLLVAILILALSSGLSQQAQAQKAGSAAKVTGKLVSVKKKGRNSILTIETSGKETKEFQITGRTNLAVTAKGDDGFLTKGQFVSAMPVRTNNNFFAKKFTVHVGPGRKVGGVKKAPKQVGISTAAWNVAGQIMDRAPDKTYEDYDVITLRAGKQKIGVFLDKGYTVTVQLADVSLAEPGSNVTIEGRPGPRDRFTVSSVKVVLAKPLKAAEFLANDKSSRKRRSTSKNKTDKSE